MLVNSALSDVPLIGQAMDTLFRAQLMAANALQKDIEARYGRPDMTVDAADWRPVDRPVARPAR
jgi:hypothetical protein